MRARRENAKPTLLRRVLACLVSAAMVVAFTPVVAWGDSNPSNLTFDIAEGNVTIGKGRDNGTIEVTYYSNGQQETKDNISSNRTITIFSSVGSSAPVQHSITVEGVVTANITLSDVSIDVSGTPDACAFKISGGASVNLNLARDNTLQSGQNEAGLQVPSGNSLTIASPSSTGSLTATGGWCGAGIGGGYNGAGGSIEINGGRVEAIGKLGAGIGGGYGAEQGGSVRITGGTVEAEGATGIGGGYNGGNGGSVTITGGTVTATSIGNGAGIGGGGSSTGGAAGSGGNVTINGGAVTAIGETGGAGIGGSSDGKPNGVRGSGGVVTITGGAVTAIGGTFGAGIGGGGNSGLGVNTSECSFSTGTNGNAVIFANSISDKTNQGSWSGVIFEGINEGMVYSSPTLCSDLTIPNGSGATASYAKTLTVPNGKTLTIASGKTLTIPQGSTLTNNGTIINKGTITNNGTLSGNPPLVPTDYVNAAGQPQEPVNAVEITENYKPTSWGTSGQMTWYVVNDTSAEGITIGGSVEVKGSVNLILADGCKITVTDGIDGDTEGYGSGSSLTIYGQENGTGQLDVTNNITGGHGAYYYGGNGGSITISGGSVKAARISGGSGGAGSESGGDGGSGGNVTIKSGTVEAGSISGGNGGNCGGATTGAYNGNGGNGGSVAISGGTVIVTGSITGGDGGYGGNSTSGSFSTTGSGNAVIFASSISDQSGKENGTWSGVIFEKNDGKVYGSSVTPTENFEIPSNSKLTVPEGSTLTISGITAENKGSVYVDGTLSGLDGDLYYPLTVTGGSADKTYAYNEKTYGKVGEVVALTRTSTPSEGYSAAWVANPSVDFNDGGFIMPAYALSITASETINKYTIAFDSNGGSDVASITKEYGAEVTAPANPTRSGYTFAGWYSDEALTQAYTFGTMPAEDITLYAKWNAVYVPPSDPSYNVPGSGEGGIAVRVTVSGSTAVVGEISALALVSAAGSGAESITIDLSGLPKGVTQAQLSKSTVDKLLAVVSDEDNAVESVTVNLGGAVLTLDAKALAAVAGQVKGANVTLGVKESVADSLNSAQQKALSPFEVVQLYFEAQIKSGGTEIHDFDGGAVRVSVAFEPKPGHNPTRYVVLYVGEDGAIERYATAWADGMLSFMAPHFSAYAVVYVEDATQAAIETLEALPVAGELKTSQAKEAVKRAEDALAEYAALDDGQKMLVDEALVANAQEVVAKGAELIAQADAKAVGKVKNKAFSVKAGKSKVIYFKTKASAAGTKVVYKKASGSKYISVTKTGKVTAKKGMKKGKTYTAKVKVVCGEAYKTVTITVKVK